MDAIENRFPQYDESGQDLVRRACEVASEVLKEETRGNGRPFIEHPLNVALIVSDEIGLPADCAAAVFLHEATRKHPEIDLRKGEFHRQGSDGERAVKFGGFPEDVYAMVDGLNKISTIRPKDTRLEAEKYKKLIVQYSWIPVTVLKIADRLEVMRNLRFSPKQSRENKILETLMLYIPLAHQLGLYNIKSEMEDIYFRFSSRSSTGRSPTNSRLRRRIGKGSRWSSWNR